MGHGLRMGCWQLDVPVGILRCTEGCLRDIYLHCVFLILMMSTQGGMQASILKWNEFEKEDILEWRHKMSCEDFTVVIFIHSRTV